MLEAHWKEQTPMAENLIDRLVAVATKAAKAKGNEVKRHVWVVNPAHAARDAVVAAFREMAADLDERSAELNAHELRTYAAEIESR
jgi:hypothetical protein